MVICTISAANHLPKAACLLKSLIDTQPKHKSVLCLVERDRSALGRIYLPPTEIVLASELGIPGFDSFMFRHRLYEACGAIKARLLLSVMEMYPDEEHFLYLDSDICAYSRFEELESLFPTTNILLTPHHVHDEESLDAIRDHMMRTLLCGIYNSGFLAVRRSPLAKAFLEWWNKKLLLLCYCEAARGLYNEQRWLDLAFSFFDIDILREPGYNVANWNVARRCLEMDSAPGSCYVNGKPLRFFHFSMIDSARDMYYFKKYLDKSSAVFTVREEYRQKVKQLDSNKLSRTVWSYDYFLSGETILEETRLAYRQSLTTTMEYPKPFHESNQSLLLHTKRSQRRPGIVANLAFLLSGKRFWRVTGEHEKVH